MNSEAIYRYLSAELTATRNDIMNRRNILRQYVTMYLLILSAFLSYGLYGIRGLNVMNNKPTTITTTSTSDSVIPSFSPQTIAQGYFTYGGIGIFITLIAGIANVGLTIFTGYQIRGLIVSRKNIACIRMFFNQFCELPIKPLAVCDQNNPEDVIVSGTYKNLHKWTLITNIIVVTSGLLFYSKFLGLSFERIVGLLAVFISIVVWYYPLICIKYLDYVESAGVASPKRTDNKAQDIYRRAQSRNRKATHLFDSIWRMLFLIVTLCFAINIVIVTRELSIFTVNISVITLIMIIITCIIILLRFISLDLIYKYDLTLIVKLLVRRK